MERIPLTLLIMSDPIYNVVQQTASAAKKSNPLVNIATGLAGALYNDITSSQQFNRNIEMWKMMAEYNKPINQRQRLKEAGLNPLFYGLDGSSAGLPQAAPEQPRENPIQSMLVAKQMQEMEGNIKVQNATADKTQAEADAQHITNEFLRDKLTDEQTTRHFQATYDSHRHQWLFNTPVDETKGTFSVEDTHVWQQFEKDYAQLRAEMAKSNFDTEYWNKRKPFVMREVRNFINSLDYDTKQKDYLAKQAEQVYNDIITQHEQHTLDLELDKSNKDFTQKMGIFGKLVDLLLRFFDK